jgi:hypothetical protein
MEDKMITLLSEVTDNPPAGEVLLAVDQNNDAMLGVFKEHEMFDGKQGFLLFDIDEDDCLNGYVNTDGIRFFKIDFMETIRAAKQEISNHLWDECISLS